MESYSRDEPRTVSFTIGDLCVEFWKDNARNWTTISKGSWLLCVFSDDEKDRLFRSIEVMVAVDFVAIYDFEGKSYLSFSQRGDYQGESGICLEIVD